MVCRLLLFLVGAFGAVQVRRAAEVSADGMGTRLAASADEQEASSEARKPLKNGPNHSSWGWWRCCECHGTGHMAGANTVSGRNYWWIKSKRGCGSQTVTEQTQTQEVRKDGKYTITHTTTHYCSQEYYRKGSWTWSMVCGGTLPNGEDVIAGGYDSER